MPTPEERFSNRVADYVRSRPSYPEAALDWIRETTGITSESVIADVGCGTGISSKLFLRRGCAVHGIEPNDAMRAAADSFLAEFPRFRSHRGTAEATTLPGQSVNLVVAAQAFHWFAGDAARSEFARILIPGGHIVVMWNARHLDTTPFLREYERLLLEFGTDYGEVRHENTGAAEFAGLFPDGYESRSFPNTQRFEFEGLRGRLLSSSYAPAAGHEKHAPMLAELARLFERHQTDGTVCFDYETEVHLGRG